ncbi:hypothetical protein [Moorena sp. SIO3I8]|uniref:hypothetical protein n=3 Tax=unclassified Moorena TaxID=2683338 RepID=UPI0013C1C68A|nr:hypothetical protein [Moorena sp. SIO3I8]NEO05906.1 hypothetical protein [Moorena sp. SIO3I8]
MFNSKKMLNLYLFLVNLHQFSKVTEIFVIVLMQSLMGESTAVAHGEGLCAEPASAPCKPRGNPQDRAASPVPLLHRYQDFQSKQCGLQLLDNGYIKHLLNSKKSI